MAELLFLCKPYFPVIRILAICKNNLFIKGIAPALYDYDIEIVGICNNSYNGREEYQRLNPDVVLMDANWAGNFYVVSGTDLIVQLKEIDENVRIVAMTNIKEPGLITNLKALGVNGYFYRTMNDPIRKIVECIKIVQEGGYYFPN